MLEHKFLFDELYDAALYKPAVALSRGALPLIERPLIAGSIDGGPRAASGSARSSSAASRTASSAPTRSCSRAGIAVLAVVFISSAMTTGSTTILILLPMAGALVVWLAADAAPLGRLAGDARLAGRGRLLDRAVQHFDFDDGALQLDQQHAWFTRLGASYYVGLFGFSLWLVGLTVVVRRGRVRLRASGPAATARAPTSGCCSS